MNKKEVIRERSVNKALLIATIVTLFFGALALISVKDQGWHEPMRPISLFWLVLMFSSLILGIGNAVRISLKDD